MGASAAVILIGALAWLIGIVDSNDKNENENDGKQDWHM